MKVNLYYDAKSDVWVVTEDPERYLFGPVFATGKTREEAIKNARTIYKRIKNSKKENLPTFDRPETIDL